MSKSQTVLEEYKDVKWKYWNIRSVALLEHIQEYKIRNQFLMDLVLEKLAQDSLLKA